MSDSNTFLVKVKVTAGAKSEKLVCSAKETFNISVREEASRGEANGRVSELLQEYYGKRAIIRLVRGQRSPAKIFSIAIHE